MDTGSCACAQVFLLLCINYEAIQEFSPPPANDGKTNSPPVPDGLSPGPPTRLWKEDDLNPFWNWVFFF